MCKVNQNNQSVEKTPEEQRKSKINKTWLKIFAIEFVLAAWAVTKFLPLPQKLQFISNPLSKAGAIAIMSAAGLAFIIHSAIAHKLKKEPFKPEQGLKLFACALVAIDLFLIAWGTTRFIPEHILPENFRAFTRFLSPIDAYVVMGIGGLAFAIQSFCFYRAYKDNILPKAPPAPAAAPAS